MNKLPMPFIVGVGRSGTTLLRLMLDAHPELSIPPETQFLPTLIEQSPNSIEQFLLIVQASHTWQDFDISVEQFKQRLMMAMPNTFDLSTAVVAFYQYYAQLQGKVRFGDKSPPYVQHMPSIQALLPQAKFIHLIRDGRDVALSYQNKWFGPGDDIEKAAVFWRDRIVNARKAESVLHKQSYIEVHYESLVLQPEQTLRKICHFIELDYHTDMMIYHQNSAKKLAQLKDNALASAEQRQFIHQNTQRPPDASQIGKWRSVFNEDQKRRFMQHTHELMRELGYEY